MIIHIIGWYCIAIAVLGHSGLMASIIQKDNVPEGSRIKVQFLIVANLAIAAWCFK